MASNDNPWGGSGGGADKPKLAKRVSEKFVRTKEVASVGFAKTKVAASVGFEKTKVAARKVKDGAAVGVNWMKLKYKLFQKK
ncbi:hypothetical protein PHJA_001759200 [Phtheirospermum japonicum]|uniref:Uncharacterized protein n=1 Tax=Phtheirospermum japonicum TaxID=374723 RepID=A0A830CP87_9LAMI|nr:hypothetical protein PHJA_001759200 [Phtheirospermum japonicum]